MSKHLLAFLLSLLAWLIASNAKAQTSGAAITTKKPQIENSVNQKKLSLSLDLSGTTDLESTESTDSVRSTDLSFDLKYQLNEDYALNIVQAISYSNNGEYEVAAANTILAASLKAFKFSEDTSLSPSVKVLLPTNEENREFDSFRGAGAASLALSHKTKIGVPLTMTLSEELLKNAHKFESKADNKANLSYRSRTAASLVFEFGNRIGLSLSASYDAGRTYQDALRTSFKLSQELSYNFSDSTSTYFSHSNGGDALGANGTDSQIKIADDRTSTISLGLRTVF